MPELPEVEVTRRRLAPVLVGRRIRRARVSGAAPLFLTPAPLLARRLRGRVARAVRRHGKYLLFELDDESRLVIHLGMTGQLFSSAARSPRLLSATARSALSPEEQASFRPDVHTHLRLSFEDGGPEVFLRDVRRFGRALHLAPGESHPRLERLGPDALRVTAGVLREVTRGRRAPIKSILLDQARIAGVGNIYADEALYRAGIRPTRRAGRLSAIDCDRLAGALRFVLRRSLETGGSSISDFVAPDGRDGRFQDERRVYARTGEPCLACGVPIRRMVVAQRSTHYCPRCQPR